ncbi:MAG: heavy-metal-associated domain-containing protein [Lachnospiraceae bacterium]|nr:heavy-metal-associated domain-containing protein [Lachnospiraceae bacterium]
MKRVFKIEDVDCANCAAKMERMAAKLDGVNKVSINFMAQRITIDAVDERFNDVVDEIEKVMKKVDKEAHIIRK